MATSFRKASLTTRLYGNALHHTKEHEWATWVCSFIYFKEDVGSELVYTIAKERLLDMPRFRSRYDADKGGFHELEESEVDLSYHVNVQDEVMDIEQVRLEYVGDVYKHFDFDPDRPLWQLVYFPKLADGRGLLFTKIAHIIGDGVSQVEVLYRILDVDESKGEKAITAVRGPKKKRKQTFGPLNRAKIFIGGVFGVISGVLSGPDTKNPFSKEDMSKAGNMKTAFSDKIPLERVKDIKKKFEGATINDILTAAMTLTINACLQEYEEKTGEVYRDPKKKIRAGFAINIRKPGEGVFKDGSPHNAVAQGLLRFQMKYKNRVDLVWKVKENLDRIKLSPLPVVQQAVGKVVLNNLSKEKSTKTFLKFYSTSTALISNVPGPAKPAFLGGNLVDDLEFLLASPKGAYIGLLSYNGQVSCCINLQESTMMDPKDFVKHFITEFDKLYDEAMKYEGMIPRPRSFWKSL